jgi:hypothetical protein
MHWIVQIVVSRLILSHAVRCPHTPVLLFSVLLADGKAASLSLSLSLSLSVYVCEARPSCRIK